MSLTDTIRADVEAFLEGVEAEHHAAGWDGRPPEFLAVYRTDEGVVDALRARPPGGLEPWEFLRAMAYGLEGGEPVPEMARSLREFMLHRGCIAYGLVAEAWAATEEKGEHLRPRDLSTVPGARECRFVVYAMGTQLRMLNRFRGEAPRWDDAQVASEGRAGHSLVRIQAAMRSAARGRR